jgi:hypothetical protein
MVQNGAGVRVAGRLVPGFSLEGDLMRRLAVLLAFMVMSVVAPVMSPAMASSSNADAAHACQGGGYSTLQTSTGGSFKNAGDCASYAAQGGTIVGVGAACTPATNGGCIDFKSVVLSKLSSNPGVTPVTYVSPAVTITLSGTVIFSPTCQVGATGCDYSTTPVSISGNGDFSTSTGLTGNWTAAYISPAPYSFTDAGYSSTTCASAAIRMVTPYLYFTTTALAGGGYVEVRQDSSATGPFKNMVYGSYSTFADGTLDGNFLSDLTGVTVNC